MQHFHAPNPLDLFQNDESQPLSLHNPFHKPQPYPSSTPIAHQQSQPNPTPEKIPDRHSTDDGFLFQKLQEAFQQDISQQNQEEDRMDFIESRKGKGRWEDRLEIAKTYMIFHEVHVTHYAYQLEFKDYYDQRNQQIQHQQKLQIKDQPPGTKEFSFQKLPKALDRRMRVKRYLQKKAKRCFIKKVSYACRKVVADQRLRVKGRFVTKKISEEITQQGNSAAKQQKIASLIKGQE